MNKTVKRVYSRTIEQYWGKDDVYLRNIPKGGLFIFRWPDYCSRRPQSVFRKTHDIGYVDALKVSPRQKYAAQDTPVYPVESMRDAG